LPVLAILPALKARDYDGDGKGATILSFVATNPLSRFSEGVRSARVAVSLSDVDEPPRVMLVTSSVPGEGKSTIASALAASAASSGLQTLLIDADLRHPSSSKMFGLEQSLGLVHLLSGAAKGGEAFRSFSNVPLTVLPAGAPTKNSPDLLGSQKMRDLLAEVRQTFDIVVVDTPPVTAVVDSLVVAPHVDKILFVVEWERTARDIVLRAFSTLGENRTRVAGVVLNKVDTERMKHRQSYYSYYSYGGKYGYGSYYSDRQA
jgi:capsular exopolysaccharide synthesis family protein